MNHNHVIEEFATEGQIDVFGQLSCGQRCDGLARICEASAWSTGPSAVYQRIVSVVADVLEADQAHLHLLTINGDRFKKCGRYVKDSSITDWGNDISLSVGRIQVMLTTLNPIVMDCANPHPDDLFSPEVFASKLKSAVCIPLVADQKVLGTCTICYRVSTIWDAEALEYLMCISRILGTVVQRMQSAKKEAELRILDERRQLSSELHDDVSNFIGALSVASASVLDSYENGDEVAVREGLDRFEALSRESMRLIRNETMSLRIPLERTDGLLVGIGDCLNTFEESWGIETRFSTDAGNTLSVPFQVSLQLIRILNECLSNVIRHSGAKSVNVSLEDGDGLLSMKVEDDGCGFDVEAVSSEKLGLKIMRERAAAAGGVLTVVSSDEGTSVCVDIRKTR